MSNNDALIIRLVASGKAAEASKLVDAYEAVKEAADARLAEARRTEVVAHQLMSEAREAHAAAESVAVTADARERDLNERVAAVTERERVADQREQFWANVQVDAARTLAALQEIAHHE